MATIDVLNLDGEKVGSLELADEVFGAINEDLLWEAVKHYRASLRAGTHATKTRGLVSGAGKKLWKQKGTGRARVGSIRSPLWRHGGTVHGPQPRSYDYTFPRKKLLGALRSALAAKFALRPLDWRVATTDCNCASYCRRNACWAAGSIRPKLTPEVCGPVSRRTM